jgi:hypothetical protein
MRLLSKQRSMKVSGSIAGSSDPAAPLSLSVKWRRI